jgi:hypothetical protein
MKRTTRKMECTECKQKIKEKTAWVNCRPYCYICFEHAKLKNGTSNRRSVAAFWNLWYKKSQETTKE